MQVTHHRTAQGYCPYSLSVADSISRQTRELISDANSALQIEREHLQGRY
jgi:hypothetical protein